ncbi:16S rRNA (cytosine(967)-C(5))-methyltransferase RsmB [Oleiagrimonas sp.]|jgi:16S rRNA (cytosine967-C5)-methyltransferase|uniref:16S rRNA (cytosine(967)-C(5))-methyltransferase RsmB n=1 Tax=Oleiagrimonas sp. TaxID=2010330 RepID=UPI002639ED6C|nr:16S rRNA (cytosine(967)-C(5))-methyltransferase RsmB [Oleiagrimonas sp.]MDA3912904.1 16S rRNA (cytosine(967)-C(5))-methyltransferase RsmB [Oleiagrimonas sp.]
MTATPALDTRALAARALADVALGGASSREILGRMTPSLGDARDRALLSALVHAGARWWLRYDAALDQLMDKSLRRKEPAVHALLVLGLVQLDVLGFPAYAAVAATVQAVRALGRPRLAGLVNAVLRRWQREAADLRVQLDHDPVARWAQPAWLIDATQHDWPDRSEDILTAANGEAPLMLRANRRHGSRERLLAALLEAAIPAHAHPDLPDAIVLEASTDVTRLPGFADGAFAVQDGSAQLSAMLLDLADGQRVLDACAAPGGKACHALECADIALTAVELEAGRIPRIHDNLSRLGLQARVLQADAADTAAWWDGSPFDRILIDAPCSATGVLRRRPDVRLHRRATDIAALNLIQHRLLESLWPLLAPGGRLLYVSCSILRAENEAVVTPFLDQHADALAVPLRLPMGQTAGPGWQVLPGDANLDGMFHAVIEKSA